MKTASEMLASESMSLPVELVEPEDAEAIPAVKELWTEYWHSLALAPDFQNFSDELRTLPGKYAPPDGRLLLVRVSGQPAGTAALRSLGNGAYEAKRLYVRHAFRRQGIAASLLAKLIAEARHRGSRNLYADTLPVMSAALTLYRDAGFVEIGPYAPNPTPGAIYLRLDLTNPPDNQFCLS